MDSKTNQFAAATAETRVRLAMVGGPLAMERMEAVVRAVAGLAKCSRLFATSAVGKPKFPSNLQAASPSIARSALSSVAAIADFVAF